MSVKRSITQGKGQNHARLIRWKTAACIFDSYIYESIPELRFI